MNRMYVTAAHGKVYHDKDEILTDYNAGKEFRVYQGYHCSIADELRMKMSGFTHVSFIWQDRNLNVMHYDLELK
jgi:hypothetical protein